MREVTIACHPLSRRVILGEYGAEPVVFPNHDFLFDLLMGSGRRHSWRGPKEQSTATITFALNDKLAKHVEANARIIADKLYRHHKAMLYWYTVAHQRAGRAARPAVADFLDLFKIDEDEYSLDNSYKLLQRRTEEIKIKNADFPRQLRRISADYLSRKKRPLGRPLQPFLGTTIRLPDALVELAVSRFLSGYSETFNRIPKRLPGQMSIYLYLSMQQMSIRETADKLKVHRAAVHRAMQSMKALIKRNRTIADLVENCALPRPEPEPAS